MLWIIQALRAETIGTDLVGYIPFFLQSNSELNFEIGFVLLRDFLRNLTYNVNVYLATISILSLLPISIIYRKYSQSIFLSYIIFVSFILYHFTFSGLRQAIAMGIIAYSYIYIEKRRLIPFLICISIAMCFHISAVIFLICYPLCSFTKISKTVYLIGGLFYLFLIIYLKDLLSIILAIIFGEGKFISYINEQVSVSYNLFGLYVLIFIWTFAIKKSTKRIEDYRKLLFLLILCQSLGFISEVATRIGYYFLLFLPLAIPEIISGINIGNKTKKYIKVGVILFMIFFFFYSNGSGYLDVIPYSFFWEE